MQLSRPGYGSTEECRYTSGCSTGPKTWRILCLIILSLKINFLKALQLPYWSGAQAPRSHVDHSSMSKALVAGMVVLCTHVAWFTSPVIEPTFPESHQAWKPQWINCSHVKLVLLQHSPTAESTCCTMCKSAPSWFMYCCWKLCSVWLESILCYRQPRSSHDHNTVRDYVPYTDSQFCNQGGGELAAQWHRRWASSFWHKALVSSHRSRSKGGITFNEFWCRHWADAAHRDCVDQMESVSVHRTLRFTWLFVLFVEY